MSGQVRSSFAVEGLEKRQLLCGSGNDDGTPPTGSASPAIVVKPNFTPVLATYAGDLLSGSEVENYSATGHFKIVLKKYNSSTGVLSGDYYVTDFKVDGESENNVAIPFSTNAHLTSGGGFDMHIAGPAGNVKLKGDYKRNNTYISGTLIGTDIQGGKTYDFSFAFDLSKRT